MGVSINYLAVLLAAIASMVVGFVWYGPMLFGKAWMKEMGMTEKSMEAAKAEMGKTYGISFLLALVTAYVMAHALVFGNTYLGMSGAGAGMQGAFYYWLGFTMPVQATDALFGKKNWKLFKLNTGYQLASLLAMGAVLSSLM